MNLRKRKWLAGSTFLIVLILMAFMWIINKGQPEEIRPALNSILFFMSAVAVICLGFFIFFGDIFNNDGKLQNNNIILILASVICIVQFTLTLVSYVYNQLQFSADALESAKEVFEILKDKTDFDNDELIFEVNRAKEIEGIHVIQNINNSGIVTASTDISQIGTAKKINPLNSYRFPIREKIFVIDISKEYQNRIVSKFALELLTLFIASVILTIELIVLAIKFIENKFDPENKTEKISNKQILKPPKMVGYVRQIAFMFYFSSRLSTTFISLLAKKLGGSFFGLDGDVLAGIPQSSEFLFTCAAIFLTSLLIEKKGWKLPFIGGLIIVSAGTVMSALANSISLFILSRAVVGLGYGFCWMTLRNFALFASDEKEKLVCFSLLNAGLYAGINCGSVFGSILADIAGFMPVLIISSIFTLLCILPILRLENEVYKKQDNTQAAVLKPASNSKALFRVILFILLMIIPSCIAGSYLNYYLPIYFSNIGRQTSDVGSAQLIYGIVMVYAGPFIVKTISKSQNFHRWNLLYNLMFGTTILVFGLTGGFVPSVIAVCVIGIADSFGFMVQNNYFLNFNGIKNLGQSKALSLLSATKKIAEMLGPVAFGFAFRGNGVQGVAFLGAVFIIFLLIYTVASLPNVNKFHNT